jgi:tetratricopeptide (TPR) repeat protein
MMPVRSKTTCAKLAIFLLLLAQSCLSLSAVSLRGGTPAVEEALAEAQRLIQKGELGAARKQLTEVMKDLPGEPAVYNLLGVVEAQEGNDQAAEARFTKAIQLAPQYEGAYQNLGRLYQQQGESDPKAIDKATETYKRLLYISPGSLEAKYQLAALSNRKGEYRASLDYLKLIPQPHRNRAQALSLLCANYAGLEDRDKAAKAAERLAKSADLTDVEVLSILPLLAKQGAQDIALQLLEGLDRRGLATTAALYELGVAYSRQSQLPEARAVLLRTAQLQPDSVPILVELARVAQKQKDHQSAGRRVGTGESLSQLRHGCGRRTETPLSGGGEVLQEVLRTEAGRCAGEAGTGHCILLQLRKRPRSGRVLFCGQT